MTREDRYLIAIPNQTNLQDSLFLADAFLNQQIKKVEKLKKR